MEDESQFRTMANTVRVRLPDGLSNAHHVRGRGVSVQTVIHDVAY